MKKINREFNQVSLADRKDTVICVFRRLCRFPGRMALGAPGLIRSLLMVFPIAAAPFLPHAAAESFPTLPGLPILEGHRLLVNGVETAIYDTPSGRFSLIPSDVPVDVTLERVGLPIKTAVLRPLEPLAAPVISGGVVRFTLPGPGAVALELDGDQLHPIFLLTRPQTAPPAPGTVTHYFEAGRVHDLPGGLLRLQSGQSVYIAAGALVRGKIEALGRVDDPVRDVRISGQGVLQGPGDGRALAIIRGADSQIEGLTVLGTNGWTVRLFEVSNINVRNVNILTSGEVCDGIDIMGGSDITVSDSFIRADDDAVAIKGKKWSFGGNVERVTLQNLVIWNGPAGNGIEIGYELEVEYVRDITARDISIIRADAKQEYTFRRAALSIHNAGSAKVSRILYENITIEQAQENLVYLWCGTSRFVENPEKPGTIRDVTFRNVRYIDGPKVPSVFDASIPGSIIEGITFENCTHLGLPIRNPESFGLQLNSVTSPTFK